jgi:hypothetical protein
LMRTRHERPSCRHAVMNCAVSSPPPRLRTASYRPKLAH